MAKNELKKKNEEIERKVNAIILQAKTAGIPSFFIAFRDEDGEAAIHFEHMPIADAVNISGNAWMRAMEINVEQNPQYAEDYRKIFTDAVDEFKGIIQRLNGRVKKYNEKHN